jgi:hypothetical protein
MRNAKSRPPWAVRVVEQDLATRSQACAHQRQKSVAATQRRAGRSVADDEPEGVGEAKPLDVIPVELAVAS